uniref:Uncharacterized protein n=1 Tax=Aegilops tauschii subsp. strangulata TaxID=200361 RepID=A0A453CL07_AEGTS
MYDWSFLLNSLQNTSHLNANAHICRLILFNSVPVIAMVFVIIVLWSFFILSLKQLF